MNSRQRPDLTVVSPVRHFHWRPYANDPSSSPSDVYILLVLCQLHDSNVNNTPTVKSPGSDLLYSHMGSIIIQTLYKGAGRVKSV